MFSTKDVFNFFFELPGHMSHSSPEVFKLVWAFAMAEIPCSDTPEFWGKVQMRGHSWNWGSHLGDQYEICW